MTFRVNTGKIETLSDYDVNTQIKYKKCTNPVGNVDCWNKQGSGKSAFSITLWIQNC